MNKIYSLLILLIFTSCLTDDEAEILFDEESYLSEILVNQAYIKDAVIACAASSKDNKSIVNVYFYPEKGASNFRLYESNANISSGTDFSHYILNPIESEPFFNGTLRLFKVNSNAAWFTVIYDFGDAIKIATPIRNKKNPQPTLWTANLEVNQEAPKMPIFTWNINSEEQNAIFFQVLANENLDLFSGTYTNENKFQYYKLNNVVLNITQSTPPELEVGKNYLFTVMDVSLDNWVNEVIETAFVVE